MPVLQTGQSFASGDQVTASKLQDIANLATFRTGANNTADGSTIEVDSSGGYLKVPSNGIGSNELSSDASVDTNRAVDTNHIKDGAVTADKLDTAAVSVLMPTASLMPYAGSAAPTGYLLCDGAAINRITFSDLFGVIGTTYGVGDGSTTFNIPDLRGRVIAGLDINTGGLAGRLTTGSAANIDGQTLGANNGNPGDTGRGTNGAQEHLLLSSESGLPDHTHTSGQNSNAADPSGSNNRQINGNVNATSGVVGGAQDASSAHNNVQPTIILNYIIKT